jgi:hypothetical protein
MFKYHLPTAFPSSGKELILNVYSNRIQERRFLGQSKQKEKYCVYFASEISIQIVLGSNTEGSKKLEILA